MMNFKPGDKVRLKESALSKKRLERHPWYQVIGRCIGTVDRITESGTAAWVIWYRHNEWFWFPFEDMEHFEPREPKYSVGDRVKVSEYVLEEADLALDPHAEEGIIVMVSPNSIQQYTIRCSPGGALFQWEEAELILCQQ